MDDSQVATEAMWLWQKDWAISNGLLLAQPRNAKLFNFDSLLAQISQFMVLKLTDSSN